MECPGYFVLCNTIYLEAGIRQVLLVLSPRDGLDVQKIRNGRDIGRDLIEIIIVHAKGVTANGRAVVGLRRVSKSIEIGPVIRLVLHRW